LVIRTLHCKIITCSLEQGWMVQCQCKVTGWGIVFICGMVLRCAVLVLKLRFESRLVTVDLTTAAVDSYKLLINDVKPVNSLTRLVFLYLFSLSFTHCHSVT